MLLALNYMHKSNIIHRDIKPANTLLAGDGVVKLADFGMASLIDGATMNLTVGTPLYMAPELAMKKKYDTKVDVWATAVIMYEMLIGTSPFIAQNREALYDVIKRKTLSFTGPRWANISDQAIDFLKKCLQKDPR